VRDTIEMADTALQESEGYQRVSRSYCALPYMYKGPNAGSCESEHNLQQTEASMPEYKKLSNRGPRGVTLAWPCVTMGARTGMKV